MGSTLFGRYKKEIQFDFVFFITNKEGIFKGYGKHLTHIVKEIQDGMKLPETTLKTGRYQENEL